MHNLNEKVQRAFKSAFEGIKYHLAMSISCVGAVSVTLFLISFSLLVAFNVENFTRVIERDLKIRVTIDDNVPSEQYIEVEQQMKQIDGVKSLLYSSKDSELAILIQENPEVFSQYKEDNPLPDVYIVEVSDAQQIDRVSNELTNIEAVNEVEYGGDSISQMIKVFMDLRKGCFYLAAALGLITLFLIINMIKMSVSTRKDEISIMRFVGASNLYIKIPFILEGMIIGFVGAVLPIAVISWLYCYLYNGFEGMMVSDMLLLKAPDPLLWQIGYILLGAGALVGMIGSFYAITRYLRWKR